MPRKQLPIRQRHRDDCRGPRDCDCPWSFRVRLPDGTMPRVTRDTYTEAEQAYYELMARRPAPLADRTTTIAQWAERWQASAEWRPATQRTRRCSIAKHILPDLGHFLMTDLRRDDVRLWVTRMRERGTGTAAMRQAVLTLRTMYGAWLQADRALPHGIPVPSGLVKEPPRREFTPLTTAQVTALAAAMPADMALMVEIEAFYGARVSEILGLRAEDITFTGLDVTAPLGPQLARVAALSADKYEARSARLRFDRKLNVDRTHAEIKNRRGYRTLPLPQWLASALAAQLGQWPPVDGWLFTNPRGPGGYRGHWDRAPHPRPWCQKNYRVWFAKAAEKTGVTLIKGQSTHALRHHCVSVLRDRGLSAQAIGYWIGDAATSVDTYYGRPMPDAMDRIAAELSGARDTGPRLRAVD